MRVTGLHTVQSTHTIRSANARLQGLQEEVLDGSDTNYSIALACFFVTVSSPSFLMKLNL